LKINFRREKMALVGQKAPEFEIQAYDPVKKEYTTVKLSDYVPNNEGKFLVVCFYPADFTFV
jgi:peroxiredoxin (alkyl hydroperoxide reductase subunit C)